MTKSDEIILQAVRMRADIEVNDRKVSVSGNKALISLFDRPVMEVGYSSNSVILFKDIPVTRKSAKVINSILSVCTDYIVTAINGYWVLKSRSGLVLPISGQDVSISMNGGIEYEWNGSISTSVDKSN